MEKTITVTTRLPFGVSEKQARAALFRTIQATPEEVLRTALEDSVEETKDLPKFPAKNPRGHTRIARS